MAAGPHLTVPSDRCQPGVGTGCGPAEGVGGGACAEGGQRVRFCIVCLVQRRRSAIYFRDQTTGADPERMEVTRDDHSRWRFTLALQGAVRAVVGQVMRLRVTSLPGAETQKQRGIRVQQGQFEGGPASGLEAARPQRFSAVTPSLGQRSPEYETRLMIGADGSARVRPPLARTAGAIDTPGEFPDRGEGGHTAAGALTARLRAGYRGADR